MKIITLNIWGGRVGTEVFEFFKKYADVDVFLLQEVFHNAGDKVDWGNRNRRQLFDEISEALPNHIGHYAPAESDGFGLAAYIKKGIHIEEVGDIFVHRHLDAMIGDDATTLGRNLQYLKLQYTEGNVTVINFHGLWNGQGKSDTEDRINQSKRMIDFIKGITGNIILAGDFNLRPDTESIKLIEKELHLKNLILEHGVTSTRTSHYTKPEKFADYIFVSPKLKVKEFKVLPEEVSDHAALYVEVELIH